MNNHADKSGDIFFGFATEMQQAEVHLRRELLEYEWTAGDEMRLRKFGRATVLAWMIGIRDPSAAGPANKLAYDVMSRNYDVLEQEQPGFRRPDIAAALEDSTEFVRIITKINEADADEIGRYSGIVDRADEPGGLDPRMFI